MSDPIAALKQRGLSEDKIVEFQAAFHLLDVDGSGVITTDNL
jgi:Ca2+-binding EF-hand superfamily protein